MSGILLVDDHPVFRRGLAFLLSTAGYDIVGEASSGTEAIDAVRELAPDLVVLDLGLPELHGIHVAERLLAAQPALPVLVVEMYDDDQSVRRALDVGVAGYVLKDASPEQMLAAIGAALAGMRVLGTGVAVPVGDSPAAAPGAAHGFTPRESAVARLLTAGLGNRAIGERLGISEKTAANYVAAVRLKIGATSRFDAARLLREE